jgi:hypothetical protein
MQAEHNAIHNILSFLGPEDSELPLPLLVVELAGLTTIDAAEISANNCPEFPSLISPGRSCSLAKACM